MIRVGEHWRFWSGTAPDEKWRETDFDDSSWQEGRSGFSSLNDEATAAYSSTSQAILFRKRFVVADPAAVKWLVLRLDFSSGFVAYLNGTEIARANLTGDLVPVNARATASRVRGVAQDFDVSEFAPLLNSGTNVLAIQLHGGPSLASALVLVPELLANFQRGPCAQNTSTSQAQVVWRTPVPAYSEVSYWNSDDYVITLSSRRLTNNHALTLNYLQPGTRYFYQVRSQAGGLEAESPVFSFRTLKTSGNLSFAVFGDSGGGYAAQFQLADVMASLEPDLVLHVGDITYPYFHLGYADTRCLSVYGAQMRGTPFYFTPGNHELYSGTDQYYIDTFYLPTNSATGTKHFYSFDHGDAHFVSLCVPTRTPFAAIAPYRLEIGSTQYRWLTNDLARSDKPWKILFMHSPLFSSSAHRWDDYDGNGLEDRVELQNILLPVAKQYGVQAMFAGHDHNYERFMPVEGVHTFVTGGGGYSLYHLTERDAASSQFWHTYECLRVQIQGGTFAMEAYNQSGQMFDRMTIQRVPPAPQLWQAGYHSPSFPTDPADDGDGNITGQSFDFTGTPIPALTGKFSNLGEVFVNNDAVNLYIGFSQAMVNSDQNVFLFIESPRMEGAAQMAGLGNGVADPDGQGADGLDFLENLSFTNFRPAIGCLLGDEFADGQFRSFARPDLNLNTGQGVFRLDPGFSDVPGARVQQFNYSPQRFFPGALEGAGLEQNADLIKVAIPLVELGGAVPGDIIRIGAVVGGGGFDTNAGTRELDSGFLGQSLSGGGLNPVVLEGLRVQLSEIPLDIDSDGDGLPDGWEVAHRLNPLSGVGNDGAQGDPDGDGMDNLQEFLADSDPQDPHPTLRLRVQFPTPGRIRISWPAMAGRIYTLETAADPGQPFSNAAPDVFPRTAASAEEYFEEAFPAQAGSPNTRFYRVRMWAN